MQQQQWRSGKASGLFVGSPLTSASALPHTGSRACSPMARPDRGLLQSPFSLSTEPTAQHLQAMWAISRVWCEISE